MNSFKNDLVTMDYARRLIELFSDEYVLNLCERYQGNTKIRWKDTIKNVVERNRLEKIIQMVKYYLIKKFFDKFYFLHALVYQSSLKEEWKR